MKNRYYYLFIALCVLLVSGQYFVVQIKAQTLAPIEWGSVERDPVQVEGDTLTPEVREVIEDLKKLDAVVYDGKTDLEAEPTTEVDLMDFEAASLQSKQIYRNYLMSSRKIRDDLLDIKDRMDATEWTLSLQQLGALSQQVTAQNGRFAKQFTHGEEDFRSYQLIQQAIHNLEEAISYWRLSRQYRKTFRETAKEQAADDHVLKVKLQRALSAIEDLKALKDMQIALKKLDAEMYP